MTSSTYDLLEIFGRGRPKQTWIECANQDLHILNLNDVGRPSEKLGGK